MEDNIVVYGKGKVTVLIDELFVYINENRRHLIYHSKPVRPYGINTVGFIREINVGSALDMLVAEKKNILRKEKCKKTDAIKPKLETVGISLPSKTTGSTLGKKDKPDWQSKNAASSRPRRLSPTNKQHNALLSMDLDASAAPLPTLDSHSNRPSTVAATPLTKLGRKRRMDDLEIEFYDERHRVDTSCKRTKFTTEDNQRVGTTFKCGKRMIDDVEPGVPFARTPKILKQAARNISVPTATKLGQKSKCSSYKEVFNSPSSIDLTQKLGNGQTSQTSLSQYGISNSSNSTPQPALAVEPLGGKIFQNAEQQRLAIEREMEAKKRKRPMHISK